MYETPINVYYDKMNLMIDNGIVRAVQNVDISVDKKELLKCLKYDRQQYEKGFRDRDEEIVRCKDCAFWDNFDPTIITGDDESKYFCCSLHIFTFSEWYCANGVRFKNVIDNTETK